ncbi:hypothetical protein AKJ08_1418 [Vulgatibacter incomptus]|uniref:Uncharacterized protein n=1 Tax=Vulgatibacter incomptus TaxID=1391653 RepID=A0A0K1PC88_9BACT|nr:hypothetical protein AKJ08_1418 [Vulgatibacter incomptus]
MASVDGEFVKHFTNSREPEASRRKERFSREARDEEVAPVPGGDFFTRSRRGT